MPDYFTTSPDWAKHAKENNIPLAELSEPSTIAALKAPTMNVPAQRAGQATDEGRWTKAHPLSSVGYTSQELSVLARDGAKINVKVSWPTNTQDPLPVVVITHGGGWIQGTHITEERWLLWPLFQKFRFIVLSISFRLAPEYPFPTWINDSEDVLKKLFDDPALFLTDAGVKPDLSRVVLGGSSAGAGISAVLSQKCRGAGLKIRGVMLNVPVLCDYRYLPQEMRELNDDGMLSYERCTGSTLSSKEMKAVWDLVIPDGEGGASPVASPLLGDVVGLPDHKIFVAGQDPLRDEGVWYARRLREAGVSTSLTVYPGVPHEFGEVHELESTQKFWSDLQRGFEELVG